MRLAISDLAFAGFRYRDLLHVPRNLGLEFFYEFGKNKYWDSVLPQIRHGHAKALSIHGPCLSINLANPAQDNCYEKIFSKTFAYASKVKADFVVVHTNEELYGDPEQLRLDVWNKLVNLDQLAHDYDITLAVENVGLRPLDTLLFDLPEFEHLLEDLPRVAVLLDTGHAHVNSWDLPKVIEHFGSRLAGVHLHDNDGLTDQHLPVGEGSIDWPPVFAALKKWAPQTRLILEYADTNSKKLATHVPELIKKYG